VRVVALPSHPYDRGGGLRWLVFIAWNRLVVLAARRMFDECRVPVRGVVVNGGGSGDISLE